MTPTTITKGFMDENGLTDHFMDSALNWFKPIADYLYDHQSRANMPLFVGLNGSQGSGKSTCSAYIKYYLENLYSLNVVIMSLDDFYLSHEQRQQLAKDIHPLLKTRGVPGTHDINLLTNTLVKLKAHDYPVAIPIFDKATDDPKDSSTWPVVNHQPDIVILEGWCWGVSPQSNQELIHPINAIEQRDEQAIWRNYVNNALASHYQPLYELFDVWLMLAAPDFSCIYKWRCEQEHKLIASLEQSNSSTTRTMSDSEIHNFIQYFQRLTEHGLQSMPASMDITLILNEHRDIVDSVGLAKTRFDSFRKEENK